MGGRPGTVFHPGIPGRGYTERPDKTGAGKSQDKKDHSGHHRNSPVPASTGYYLPGSEAFQHSHR